MVSELTLRPYQIDSLRDVRAAFRDGAHRVICVLPCGAGKTVLFAYMSSRHIAQNPDNRVLFLVHRRELIRQTEEAFSRFGLSDPRISIMMAQTAVRRLDSIQRPTFIVFDEAHHASANTWRRIISAFPNVPCVGLTATPARLDGQGLGDQFDRLCVGISAQELVERGYLSQYDYYAPKTGVVGSEFRRRGSDFDQDSVASEFERAKIVGDVRKYYDPSRKTIAYCPTVAFSKKLAAELGGVHFDRDTPTAERDEIVRKFRSGEIRLLCNVDLIGEGFDVPDCDAVMLLRPTQSTSLFIQQSCRALRPAPGKRAVIHDFVGNCFRHGLPTDDREWSLAGKIRAANPSGEPEVTCRTCSSCFRVYPGTSRVCPYCGADNGKTRREIERDQAAELERVEAMQRVEARREQGMCRTFGELYALAVKRGYSNPRAWALFVLRNRR